MLQDLAIETAGYVKHCHLFVAAKNPQNGYQMLSNIFSILRFSTQG